MILFDGNGIHSGGFVYEGNREALQVIIDCN